MDNVLPVPVPCDFCGESPEHGFEEEGDCVIGYCHCVNNDDGHYCGVIADTEAQAIERWNERWVVVARQTLSEEGSTLQEDLAGYRDELTEAKGLIARLARVVAERVSTLETAAGGIDLNPEDRALLRQAIQLTPKCDDLVWKMANPNRKPEEGQIPCP